MNIDYLVIGQGICGTLLTVELEKAGKSFIVIDTIDQSSASRVAAGVINPITGRRLVSTWMAEELHPYAYKSYTDLGRKLGITAIERKDIIDFFLTPQIKNAFCERADEEPEYLSIGINEIDLAEYFSFHYGYGIIHPCYQVNLSAILDSWRQYLVTNNLLLDQTFQVDQLKIEDDHIEYNDIQAEAVIFCDGVSSYTNPFFPNLPFAANKGEAIIIRCDGLPVTNIFKKGITIAPMNDGNFWIGSSYEWEFDNDQPTDAFRTRVENILREWLKLPFQVIDHKAALRPATLERRPFVGLHPLIPQVGILNGMGTKGCSLAPFFAAELTEHLVSKTPINPAADVGRFRKVLARTNQ